MKHYVGLDLEETAICILDDQRWIGREGKAASEPEAIAALPDRDRTRERVGIEAGPPAPWLTDGGAAASLPVICIDARYMAHKDVRVEGRPTSRAPACLALPAVDTAANRPRTACEHAPQFVLFISR